VSHEVHGRGRTPAIARHKGEPIEQVEPLDWWLRYEDDERAQAVVEAHPDGMTHVQIAAYMGVCRERIRQIETCAIRRLVTHCEAAGISRADVVAMLGSKPSYDLPDVSGSGGYIGRGRAGTGADHWSVRALPVEPYSARGLRAEAEIAELERLVARLEAR